MEKFENYNEEEILDLLKGCFYDPNTVVSICKYGYLHDTGFTVEVNPSTSAQCVAGYAGTSKELFVKEFRSNLLDVSAKWSWKYGN